MYLECTSMSLPTYNYNKYYILIILFVFLVDYIY